MYTKISDAETVHLSIPAEICTFATHFANCVHIF